MSVRWTSVSVEGYGDSFALTLTTPPPQPRTWPKGVVTGVVREPW